MLFRFVDPTLYVVIFPSLCILFENAWRQIGIAGHMHETHVLHAMFVFKVIRFIKRLKKK